MKLVLVIGIVIGLILTSISMPIIPVDSKEGANLAPSAITYISTNITVNDTQVWQNQTIVLSGNLTVESGGNLTLENVTLIMNSSSSRDYRIEVKTGATMIITDIDNNNSTTGDATNITATDPNYGLLFWVRDGSNFSMNNSELHRCGGWALQAYYPVALTYGLYINTDRAVIDHNNFSYNYDGLVLYNSDAVVSNNTFYWNDVGIEATTYSDALIENNWIGWSKTYGMEIDGWDNTNGPWPSNPIVRNNVIYKTGRDAYTAVPITVDYESKPRLDNNTIIDWTEDGIYIGERSDPIINNTYMQPDGGNYGMVFSSSNVDTIYNTSIAGPTVKEHIYLGSSAVTVTNTTFDHSSLFINSGFNLTVNWYLHVYVNDSAGKPIPNATVHITDNANGTYDENFTTDENGRVNWIVLTDYWQNSTTTIDYNDYTVSISYPGVSFIDNNRSVKMNISRTEVFTAEPEPRTAAATGPTNAAPSNTANITITYTNSTNTSSVGLYYTVDNGSTWTFIGNDTEIDGSYAWTIPEDGVYGWMAVGDDESAPVEGDAPEAFSYTYDGTAPNVTGTVPADAAVNVSVGQTVIITFSEAVDTTTFNFTCEPDPGNWSESWNATNERVSLEHPDFAVNTTYWINVTSANDTARNALAGVYSFHFTTEVPDTAVPLIIITSPQDNAIFNSSSVTVTWAGSDNGTGIEHYEVRIDGGAWENVSTNTSYNFSDLSDDSHTVDVKAVDNATNEASDSVTFTIDTTGPEVSIILPASGAIVNTSSLTTQWTGSDTTSGINHYEVRADNGSWEYAGTSTSYGFDALPDGAHTVEVRAIDGAGNTNSATVSFTVDTTPPVLIAHSPAGTNISVNSTISVTFSESMNTSSVQISMDIAGTISWDGNTALFTPGVNLTAGTLYIVNVVGKDLAGNRLEPYSWNFTTESEGKTITAHTGNISGVVTDEDGNPVADAIVTVQGTNISTVTDSTGHFLLENVSAGLHNLTISRNGFKNTTMQVTVVKGENYAIHVILEPVGSKAPANQLPWWILGLAALVIIAALYVKKRRSRTFPKKRVKNRRKSRGV